MKRLFHNHPVWMFTALFLLTIGVVSLFADQVAGTLLIPPPYFLVLGTGNGSTDVSLKNGSGALNVVGSGFQLNGVPEIYYVTADFTLAGNTNLQTITGLSWTIPASTATNIPFTCDLMYSQATAAVADQFGIQDATTAPTNIAAKGDVDISASTFTAGNLPTLTTTTATAIVTFTPSAITTVWNARLSGLIQQPSGAASAINIMAQTSNASDLVTVKQGSFCKIY